MLQIQTNIVEPQGKGNVLYFTETTGENCESNKGGYGSGNPELTDVVGTEFILKKWDGTLYRADMGYRTYLGQIAIPAKSFYLIDETEEPLCGDCLSDTTTSDMTYYASGCYQLTYRVYGASGLLGQNTSALLLIEDANVRASNAVIGIVTKKCDESDYITTKTVRMGQLSDAVKAWVLLESIKEQEWDCKTIAANIERAYNFLGVEIC